LVREKAAGFFTERAHKLAHVEKKTALDKFHDDEHKVGDQAARGLEALASISEVEHADNSGVLHILQNGYFVLHADKTVIVTFEEFFFK
jgi:hypothetical protein